MTAKSARAAVDAAKPSANTPITKANFFIVQLPKAQPTWFDSTEPDIQASPRAADAWFAGHLTVGFFIAEHLAGIVAYHTRDARVSGSGTR
jgi:hypothetical protein